MSVKGTKIPAIEPDYLTLDVIAGAGFRSTAETDERATYVKDALGFGAFNIPARLAIAKSLAVEAIPPASGGEPGRSIKGETLFGVGPDLASWISLIIEHRGELPKSLKELQALVAAHWCRGMKMLEEEVVASNGDSGEFWRILAETALPATGREGVAPLGDVYQFDDVSDGPISLKIGEIGLDVTSGDEIVFRLNAPGGSPHMAFMGGVGSGKTRTAAYMLRSLAEQSNARLLAFDFKGDMDDEYNRIGRAFEAKVLNPMSDPIPLDVFWVPNKSKQTIVTTAQRVRDSLSNLKQTKFGDVQRRRLNDAVEIALQKKSPCRLEDIRDSLQEVYAEAGAKEDGAIGSLVDLCRLPLFVPELSPAQFFSQSWLISLPADVPEVVRVAVVSLLTDALERYVNSMHDAPIDNEGNRSLRLICVIDEAHKILGSKLPGLNNLIRLGRSKGASIMLISQKPDDFEGEDDDFLSEMGLIASFATNAKDAAVRRILGSSASLSTLNNGEAIAKLRGESRSKKIQSWQ